MTREEIMAMGLEEIEQRASSLIEELEKAETNEAMDAIQEEIDSIEERKNQIQAEIETRKNDMAAVINQCGSIIEEMGEKEMPEIRNSNEYINAFAEYIKTGNDVECRKLTTTNDTTPNGTGTVAVPDFVYDIVKTAWDREGIMSLVRKSYLKGNLKVQFEASGSDAAIHAEGASAVSEETLVLGIVSLVPQSIKKWINYQVA